VAAAYGEVSRLGVCTVAFFLFWAIIMMASAMTSLLAPVPAGAQCPERRVRRYKRAREVGEWGAVRAVPRNAEYRNAVVRQGRAP
jgi:hypothetical protein